MRSGSSYLIVNADDYGYFDCVSRGIPDASHNGIVTATGIFANSIHFNDHVDRLIGEDKLDPGVHLNLTDQAPLTESMSRSLSRWAGLFPDKYSLVKALLTGTITIETVAQEWRAQIERCLGKKLKIHFLNSHEHIHMLPPLFKLVQSLADEYHIPNIRLPTPEQSPNFSIGTLIRDGSLKTLSFLNRRSLKVPAPRFLGMGESGRLSISYLKSTLPQLRTGEVYELMCHPGYYDPNEIIRPNLLDYHDWQRDFDTLTSPEVHEMLLSHNIRLIGYRHVTVQAGKFTVRKEEL